VKVYSSNGRSLFYSRLRNVVSVSVLFSVEECGPYFFTREYGVLDFYDYKAFFRKNEWG
jgi:hypothetical protein